MVKNKENIILTIIVFILISTGGYVVVETNSLKLLIGILLLMWADNISRNLK